MNRTLPWLCVLSISMTCTAPISVADSGESITPDVAEIDQRIARIENEIRSLKREKAWMAAEDAEQLRALMNEIAMDSSRRTSLLSDNGTAGYRDGRGFYLGSSNGDFLLTPDFFIQFGAIWNMRDDNGGVDGSVFGFETRRARVILKGHAFGPDLRYHVSGEFRDQQSGDFMLKDAYLRAKIGEGWSIWWGQMKAPFSREESVPDRKQLAVDRSYVNEVMKVDRTQGFMIKYHPEQMFRIAVMMNDGVDVNESGVNGDRGNTPFDNDGAEYGFSGRGEFLWADTVNGSDKAAMWGRFADFRPSLEESLAVLIGGGIHWQQGEYGTPAPEREQVLWTADATGKYRSATISGAVSGLHSSSSNPAAADFDQIGISVQGAYALVDSKIDVFGRYEYIDLDGAVPSGYDDNVSLLTCGFNYYFAESGGRKLTTDIVFALDPIPASASNIGLLMDTPDGDNQIVLRSQYTLALK